MHVHYFSYYDGAIQAEKIQQTDACKTQKHIDKYEACCLLIIPAISNFTTSGWTEFAKFT